MNDSAFNIDETVREEKIKQFSSNVSEEIELHHIVGKSNSVLKIPISKTWHDLISSWQNSLAPKDKKNQIIMFIESVAAMLDLLSKSLRYLSFMLRSDNYEYVLKKSNETKNKKNKK